MKTKKLTGVLLLFLSAVAFCACHDEAEDKVKPITLEYEDPQFVFDNENRFLTFTPFSEPTRPLLIKGGDGSYKITNSREEVV